MVFGTLEDMIDYISSASSKSIEECGEEMVRILQQEIRNQVSGWEGNLFGATQISNITNDSVEVEVADYQGWTSLAGSNKGQPFENAMIGLEGGYTWGRGASNIMEEASKTCESVIPREYLQLMRSKGIPIK